MSLAFYNEHDPKAAAWLRELIKSGHIAPGIVDERSITEIKPHELRDFTQCHFFAGIGGWSYALRLAGWADERPVGTGSCPCQPFSDAGKGLAEKDERHLWPAWFALIRECHQQRQPWAAMLFGEQVASKAALQWLDGVFADLEGTGHACAAADLCAAGVGAPHIRQRLYWMAIANSGRLEKGSGKESENAQSQSWDRILEQRGSVGGLAYASSLSGTEQRTESRERNITGPEDAAKPGSTDQRVVNTTCEQVELSRLARESRSAARGLAISDGGNTSAEGQQRSGEHGQQRQDGGADRLEHTASERREQRGTESGGRCPCARCVAGGLGHAELPGSQGRGLRGNGTDERTARPAGLGSWNHFDFIPCADGKARRIESGTFPLAHGVSGRVGLLRGYGNAIVPEQASEFIQSCEEALKDFGR